jgi:hypothetical protein
VIKKHGRDERHWQALMAMMKREGKAMKDSKAK